MLAAFWGLPELEECLAYFAMPPSVRLAGWHPRLALVGIPKPYFLNSSLSELAFASPARARYTFHLLIWLWNNSSAFETFMFLRKWREGRNTKNYAGQSCWPINTKFLTLVLPSGQSRCGQFWHSPKYCLITFRSWFVFFENWRVIFDRWMIYCIWRRHWKGAPRAWWYQGRCCKNTPPRRGM